MNARLSALVGAARWIVPLLFIAPHCATVDRGRDATSVALEGGAVYPADRTHGCEGEVLSQQRHEQIGGRVSVEHRGRHGLRAGTRLSFARGRLIEQEGLTLDEPPRTYTMAGAGAWLGYDLSGLGGDLGVNFSIRPEIEATPFVVLRAGDFGALWAELSGGFRGGLFDGQLMGVALAGEIEGRVRLRGGFGGYMRPFVDAGSPGRLNYATWGNGSLDWGFDLHGELLMDGWSVRMSGVFGQQPAIMAGFAFELPGG